MKRAVIALSACRAFSEETYRALQQNPRLASATRPAFEVLTGFSFMWHAARERGEQWFRVHALLRRLLAEREDAQEVLHDSHVALEDYYRQQVAAGNQDAIAEVVYHINRLDWQRGVNEWVAVFDKALELSQYGLCGLLLEVQQELQINNDFSRGYASNSEGQYFARLAQHADALASYTAAIKAYDAALSRVPDDVDAHNNKGSALMRCNVLRLQSGDSHDGFMDLRSAIQVRTRSLAIAPGDQRILQFRNRA